jgi:hypothetical protein
VDDVEIGFVDLFKNDEGDARLLVFDPGHDEPLAKIVLRKSFTVIVNGTADSVDSDDQAIRFAGDRIFRMPPL